MYGLGEATRTPLASNGELAKIRAERARIQAEIARLERGPALPVGPSVAPALAPRVAQPAPPRPAPAFPWLLVLGAAGLGALWWWSRRR